MASKEEVESFLKNLKTKIEVFDLAFRNRSKNLQALADLDIAPNDRKQTLLSLQYRDYCSGPISDTDVPGAPDYYVFGKKVNGTEVYIKINLGRPNKMVDCISFHPSEHPLTYPFQT